MEILKLVDVQVNSNDRGKQMFRVESKKEVQNRVNFLNHCYVLLEFTRKFS